MKKAFVITIMDNEQSVQMADRCISTFEKHNPKTTIEKFDAITPAKNPFSLAELWKIPAKNFIEKYSRHERCVSAFLSHMSLWRKSMKLDEPIIIFEHDAVTVAPIRIPHFTGLINLGKPSYGKFQMPQLGVGPLVSKQYMPGAHAYAIRPEAARILCEQAVFDAAPTDVYLNRKLFPWIQELYPWPVECRDTFTTIQNETGCLAKHNYGQDYEII